MWEWSPTPPRPQYAGTDSSWDDALRAHGPTTTASPEASSPSSRARRREAVKFVPSRLRGQPAGTDTGTEPDARSVEAVPAPAPEPFTRPATVPSPRRRATSAPARKTSPEAPAPDARRHDLDDEGPEPVVLEEAQDASALEKEVQPAGVPEVVRGVEVPASMRSAVEVVPSRRQRAKAEALSPRGPGYLPWWARVLCLLPLAAVMVWWAIRVNHTLANYDPYPSSGVTNILVFSVSLCCAVQVLVALVTVARWRSGLIAWIPIVFWGACLVPSVLIGLFTWLSTRTDQMVWVATIPICLLALATNAIFGLEGSSWHDTDEARSKQRASIAGVAADGVSPFTGAAKGWWKRRRVVGTPGQLTDALDKFGERNMQAGVAGERRTADLLAELAAIPGIRVLHGMPFPDSTTADVDHLVVCGDRVAIVDSKMWKRQTYSWGSREGELLVNGKHSDRTGTHMPFAVKGYQFAMGSRAEVRAWILVHPKPGTDQLVLDNTGATKVRLGSSQSVVRELLEWFAPEYTGERVQMNTEVLELAYALRARGELWYESRPKKAVPTYAERIGPL